MRVYSVWVPILVSDSEGWVSKAMERLPDQRITHYWDGQDELVEKYKTILPTRRVDSDEYAQAWDVYLLFASDAEWKDQPPAPNFWMHQLRGVDPKNRFNAETLAAEVKRLLN